MNIHDPSIVTPKVTTGALPALGWLALSSSPESSGTK